MRPLLLCIFVFVSWQAARASQHISLNDQVQVSTALDMEQFILDTTQASVDDERAAIDDALDITDNMSSMKIFKKQSALAKVGSMLGSSLKAVHAAGAVAGFVFTFLMSQSDDVQALINKRFNEVNAKLDNLDEKLDEVQQSIKANVAFNVFLAQWIEWENMVENGAVKLRQIRRELGKAGTGIEKIKLAEEFVKYYEDHNLDHNLLNLYKMAAKEEGTTHRNIFDLFIAEYGCDISMLSRLMIVIKNVMTSGSQQKLTYYMFKGQKSRAKDGFEEIQKQFYEIRHAFDSRVWTCRADALERAQTDAKKHVKELKSSTREAVVQALFKRLKVKYPQFAWAVAAAKNRETNRRDFDQRGDSFFTVEEASDSDNVKVYYVMYGDPNAYSNCRRVDLADTLLVFKPCDGCAVAADRKILSKDTCGTFPMIKSLQLDETEVAGLGKCNECKLRRLMTYLPGGGRCDRESCTACDLCAKIVIRHYVKPWHFLASKVTRSNDACSRERCNEHGICREIPNTKAHQCICDDFYEGESCETRVTFDDTIEKMMSHLRYKFNIANGVPTTVDVYFEIKDLKKSLEVVMQKISSSFAHTNQLIQHAATIQDAEDVADLYSQLQMSEMSFNKFGETMDRYLSTVSNTFQLENRFKKMLLAQGTLARPGGDIYNTLKRDYVANSGRGCIARYNADVKKFRDSLAYLDEAVGEAQLLYHEWLINTKADSDAMRTKYKNDADYIKRQYQGRQEEFNAYWQGYSCGELEVEGADSHCKSELTYEGLAVPIRCDQERQADLGTATCVRQNGRLQWDSQPVCKFVWGNFTDWSECSQSCDSGVRFQNRTCLGTNDVANCERDQGDTSHIKEVCNTRACCSAEFDKFQCSNGKCINTKQVCDGRNNCGNNDDENSTVCPQVVRSGMAVAFENVYRRHQWLSCFCMDDRNKCWKLHRHCTLGTCPGTVLVDEEWSVCFGEKFYVFGLDRQEGEAIRYGDRVGLKYRSKEGTQWLSCKNSYCGTDDCPGKSWDEKDNKKCRSEAFKIFAPARQGPCSDNIKSGCIGMPIEQGDEVLLSYSNYAWLTEHREDIMRGTCTGTRVSGNSDCQWERWNIFAQELE